MGIKIYTYKNPYEIDKELYWNEISDCPYFCATQTLVNGLQSINLQKFQNFRLRPIKALLDELYEEWCSVSTIIKQNTIVDNIINNGLESATITEHQKNIYKAFTINQDDVIESLRVLMELNVDYNIINQKTLTEEQSILLCIYIKILQIQGTSMLDDSVSFSKLDQKLKEILINNHAQHVSNVEKLNFNKVVIHGVHQFTPLMLRMIDGLSKQKEVILLFNYQSQYKNIYQTWIDIYSNFESKIQFSNCKEFAPTDEKSTSFLSNALADNMGRLSEGNSPLFELSNKIEFIEFETMIEFANYVAGVYQKGLNTKVEMNPLKMMKEQFYAADSSVNEILKLYFPQQFGERQFINYPFGHFFVSISNMWDSENNNMKIKELSDVRECLSSNIIYEQNSGKLLTIFDQVSSLFEGCKNLSTMIKRLERVKKNKKRMDEDDKENIDRLSYYHVSKYDLDLLIEGLKELESIANYFFYDFEKHKHNFDEFYSKMRSYLNDTLCEKQVTDEFKGIIKRVLEHLNTIEDIQLSASFQCLKSTMSIYLKQEEDPMNSARWIVRDFEQIDGDILRSNHDPEDRIYHFACLSDENMNATPVREFPWPLTSDFFMVSLNPIDWKYQVYVEACLEYKNFKKYALLYGLEFNKRKVRLSYIKKTRVTTNQPYYVLSLFGIHPEKYAFRYLENQPIVRNLSEHKIKLCTFDDMAYYRYQLCPYRFLLEDVVEGNTIYKDNFTQNKYLEILINECTRKNLVGDLSNLQTVYPEVVENYEAISKFFPFELNINRIDIINTTVQKLLKTTKGTFNSVRGNTYKLAKAFIDDRQLTRFMKENILLEEPKLDSNTIFHLEFDKNYSTLCKYCGNRDICLEKYKLD